MTPQQTLENRSAIATVIIETMGKDIYPPKCIMIKDAITNIYKT